MDALLAASILSDNGDAVVIGKKLRQYQPVLKNLNP